MAVAGRIVEEKNEVAALLHNASKKIGSAIVVPGTCELTLGG